MQSDSTDVHTIWQKGDGTRATEETINFWWLSRSLC